jgi:microcystin-dependent protein
MAGIKIADLPSVTSSLAADDRIPISRSGVTYQLVGELFIPTGTIIAFASDSVTPPGGWLYCDGAPYSTTAFSRLNGVIGTKYNVTTPPTGQFRVPDLRGRFIRGYATVAAGGIDTAAFGAWQDDALQGHIHNASSVSNSSDAGHAHSIVSSSSPPASLAELTNALFDRGGVVAQKTGKQDRGNGGYYLATTGYASITTNTSTSIGNPLSDGSSGTPRTSTETRPRNIAVYYYIKY